MTKTQTATAKKPNVFLQAFAVFLAIIGALLFCAVVTGTFLNI